MLACTDLRPSAGFRPDRGTETNSLKTVRAKGTTALQPWVEEQTASIESQPWAGVQSSKYSI
eukprot:scaffold1210_cov410-Prasinococcus_capsulatus_cf.AAC.17